MPSTGEFNHRNSAKTLERFAINIENKLRAQGHTSTIENIICRALTQRKNLPVAAKMAALWVEWRYGKAKETVKLTGTITHVLSDSEKREAISSLKRIEAFASDNPNPIEGEIVEDA